ncbi:protein adenylyltransferase SelO [Roseicitreum antarcticum]|uniref:Protein nucleotidyltransferase YdiU n=1 Tax=Roseicitreum antarcticum TaxID=564137 RepID=A0A1H3CCP0_9RHOB|nr:YdiU family protein [Roseicitreum antarcticum]SDX51800.1 Uncharacterized conserved protein YdiU, UPF0061 family [Roseicitreum antarcticum]
MIEIAFDNSYARLPERLFAHQMPSPASDPALVVYNRDLAADLGLPDMTDAEATAVFSGSIVPDGAAPLAMAYAGHQFGGFVPALGDGRAILLGEVVDRHGIRQDIQLKGAGRTPFSRGGDGRAWLGPVLREYLVSEAMAALGVPTTRALAATLTGDPVYREGRLPGAIVTRVARSHLRVGTFQYFAARHDREGLQALTDHAIARHFPDAQNATDLLRAVVAAQAELIAQWMGLGFIHGVMNTDNSHIGGLTIDYGPCAFMDAYRPDMVFSSIDRHGRYAYGNQPQIAVWNMAQLATCLLPLIDPDQEKAIEIATEIVHDFEPQYQTAWLARFRAKLGLATAHDNDRDLIEGLLTRMAQGGADFTRTFHGLADGTARAEFAAPEAYDQWHTLWQARLASEVDPHETLRGANPAIIPRNHLIETAIWDAVAGDFTLFHKMLEATQSPFLANHPPELMAAPDADQRVTATFCGT